MIYYQRKERDEKCIKRNIQIINNLFVSDQQMTDKTTLEFLLENKENSEHVKVFIFFALAIF